MRASHAKKGKYFFFVRVLDAMTYTLARLLRPKHSGGWTLLEVNYKAKIPSFVFFFFFLHSFYTNLNNIKVLEVKNKNDEEKSKNLNVIASCPLQIRRVRLFSSVR